MKKLGIVKETKNKWERRVPLNPKAVNELIQKGFEVFVQPSETRIYINEEYKNAGAILNDDLSKCDFIIGVKEIPIDSLIPGKPHLFFSHTIKGQDYNMPLLENILDKKITLLDYEKIEDDQNRRLVFFGKFAGYAGMVDTLHGLGQRLKQQFNIETPFLQIKHSYQYNSVQNAIDQISKIGKEIELNGLPSEITPLNIFLLGYGHVSQGCQKILSALPIVEISPNQLEEHSHTYQDNKIYLTVFKEQHLVERKDGGVFSLQDYFANNSAYKSKLDQYLPYCSVYMNAIYWTSECPVFLPNSYLINIQGKNQKLVIIGDITCDIEGSVQATVKGTWPDNPVFIYDAKTGIETDGYEGEGFAVMAVDNLPCEFPKEASDCFSKSLTPFMESILLNDYSNSIADSSLPNEIKSACITHQGKLEKDFQYLEEFIK
ncbi:MAG: bifunctional lysine ketoglutarate reductase /saccharopine dehydrogenase family protein [Candidatus Cloacimonetes bacterium]|jgi:saccharopine dehydrogenase (NAD+, L-lysine-forming)|nr:bifunctional lysine ketoglutarate reductase /saccharopine dehydrogenase family protein [Candidatus Cloacimonadota bacterium]